MVPLPLQEINQVFLGRFGAIHTISYIDRVSRKVSISFALRLPPRPSDWQSWPAIDSAFTFGDMLLLCQVVRSSIEGNKEQIQSSHASVQFPLKNSAHSDALSLWVGRKPNYHELGALWPCLDVSDMLGSWIYIWFWGDRSRAQRFLQNNLQKKERYHKEQAEIEIEAQIEIEVEVQTDVEVGVEE
jgi:hypothetical protein